MRIINIYDDKTFDMWFHQNKGEVADSCEGALLDNLLVYCKRGIALVKENYVHAYKSDYKIYFGKYNTEDEDKIIHNWNKYYTGC